MVLEAWYVLIIVVGVIIGRRYGRFISLTVMIELNQLGLLLLTAVMTGNVEPMLLIPGVGILPKIGRYSGISAGGLIPPLIFVLVAILTRRRAQEG